MSQLPEGLLTSPPGTGLANIRKEHAWHKEHRHHGTSVDADSEENDHGTPRRRRRSDSVRSGRRHGPVNESSSHGAESAAQKEMATTVAGAHRRRSSNSMRSGWRERGNATTAHHSAKVARSEAPREGSREGSPGATAVEGTSSAASTVLVASRGGKEGKAGEGRPREAGNATEAKEAAKKKEGQRRRRVSGWRARAAREERRSGLASSDPFSAVPHPPASKVAPQLGGYDALPRGLRRAALNCFNQLAA